MISSEDKKMSTQFLVHLEPADETGVVWWAETPSVAGLSVAANTLQDLYVLALEALETHLGPEARLDVRFDLVPDAMDNGSLRLKPAVDRPLQAGGAPIDFEARRAVLNPA